MMKPSFQRSLTDRSTLLPGLFMCLCVALASCGGGANVAPEQPGVVVAQQAEGSAKSSSSDAVTAEVVALVALRPEEVPPAWISSGSASVPVTASFFGLHIHRAAEGTSWPGVPFAGWRLWDAAVSWERLEPRKGEWDFSRLDQLIDLAERHGVEPVLTLGITPRWAASRPDRQFVYGLGGNSMPRDLSEWDNYVRTVASRYRGRLRYFELWNEPTFDEIDRTEGFFAGSVHDMVALGRVAHAAIKSVDPDAKLISPGFTDEGRRLGLYLSSGGLAYTDIVAHHFYADTPELNAGYVQHIRDVMNRAGAGSLPLWDTESGYTPGGLGQSWGHNLAATPTDLAAYVVRHQLVLAAQGVQRSFSYSWEGLAAGESAGPLALQVAQRWLGGAQIVGCLRAGTDLLSPWACKLARQGRNAWVAWSPRGPADLALPDVWRARFVQTTDAAIQPLRTRTLRLTRLPVVLTNEATAW